MLLDNASIHFTKKVTDWAEENEVNLVRNQPYMPEYQAIENYWNILKVKVKKSLLR